MKLSEPTHNRLKMLDGWRAISITMVLAGHMLPLGPARWRMNEAVAANGMAVFFTLSGFLIVSILRRDADVVSFLIRRFARILPLAWLALVVSFLIKGVVGYPWIANMFFFANLPPFYLEAWSSHFWSLDLEMQFYAAIAAIVAVFGRRGLSVVPVAALGVTTLRIVTGTEISIVTWFRVDEILAGGILALIIQGNPAGHAIGLLKKLPFTPLLALTLLSTWTELGSLAYARPYLTAAMVGVTIVRPVWMTPLLVSRPAAYLSAISYAVYVIHHFTLFGWLGTGDGFVKYAKRPLSFLITFSTAHASTFYFERPITNLGHRITSKRFTLDLNAG